MSYGHDEPIPQEGGAHVLAKVWQHYWVSDGLPAADGEHFYVQDGDRFSPVGLFLGSGLYRDLVDADLNRILGSKPFLRHHLSHVGLQVLGAVERAYRECVRRAFVVSPHGVGGKYVEGGAFRREIGKAIVAIATHFKLECAAYRAALEEETARSDQCPSQTPTSDHPTRIASACPTGTPDADAPGSQSAPSAADPTAT